MSSTYLGSPHLTTVCRPSLGQDHSL